jgi:hypothetical protein
MKKSFLLFSAISVLGAANAQQDRSVAIDRHATNHMAKIDQNQLTPSKTVTIPNAKAASTIDIGTSYNVYGILGDRQNQVVYNPDINTVAFVHRQNDGGPGGANASGIMSIDYSTDGGATWTVNPYQTTPTGSGATWNGNRYPNMAIYNPTSNTNSANAFMVQAGPALETGTGSNDNGWAKTFRSSFKLDGTLLDESYDFNSMSTLNDPNEWGAAGLYVTSQGTVWYAATNNNNSGATPNPAYDVDDNYSEYFLVRGDFNATNDNFDWTVVDTIAPNWNTTDNNGTAYNMSGLMNMAWSVDGNTGYLVIMGSWGANTMWRPYVMKTTDAGATWNNVNDFDFSNDPVLQCQVFPANIVGTPRPWFADYDLIVGNDDELRIFVDIQSQSSAHPDSLLYAFTATQSHGLYEVVTNGTGWDVTFVDSIYVADHEYDATNQLSHFVRPQASRAQDGSKVFYTWLASDPTLSIEREFPVVHSRGHDISSDMWTPITNLSSGTNADFVSAYATMSVDVIQNGTEKAFELPIVYGTDAGSALSNGLTAPQWTFLRGVGFDGADFTETAIADPCAVGVEENTLVESNVSLFPNPTNGSFEIILGDINNFNYTVFDIVGNVVANSVVNGNRAKVDLSNNAKGAYFVSIETAEGSITKKVMLTK